MKRSIIAKVTLILLLNISFTVERKVINLSTNDDAYNSYLFIKKLLNGIKNDVLVDNFCNNFISKFFRTIYIAIKSQVIKTVDSDSLLKEKILNYHCLKNEDGII